MSAKILLLLLPVLAVGGLLIKGQVDSTPSVDKQSVLAANTAADSGSLTQVDLQDGIKVSATYLTSESSLTESVLEIKITSDRDMSDFDFAQKVVWADSNIDPLPTLSSVLLRRQPHDLEFRMSFERRGRHHHLLISNLGSIRHRVLHFYL